MTKDPVCGMKINEKDAAATATYEGTQYFFCSHGCHAAFLADSAKYAASK